MHTYMANDYIIVGIMIGLILVWYRSNDFENDIPMEIVLGRPLLSKYNFNYSEITLNFTSLMIFLSNRHCISKVVAVPVGFQLEMLFSRILGKTHM